MSQPADTRKSVLVTGSSGLIGSRVVERLAPRYRVFALDVAEPDGALPEGAQYLQLDVTSDAAVGGVVKTIEAASEGAPIASVVHLAAYYDFSGEPSDLYEKVTVEGTRRLLASLGKSPLAVEQFLFSSTMLVHAPTEPGKPITEDDPLDPAWDYPRSKVETEEVIHRERGDIPAVHLRIAGAYSDRGDSIPLSHQIQRIVEKRLTGHVYPGDTDRGQAFVHLDDLLDAIERTVERRGELPEEVAILVGEPETPSYDRLQREIARQIHGDSDWTTQRIPKAVAKTGAWFQDRAEAVPGVDEPFIKPWMVDRADDHYELDTSRAEKLLGWRPRHRLVETLPEILRGLEADPESWYARHDLDAPKDLEERLAAAG